MPLVYTVKPCHCVVCSTFAKWMTSRFYFKVWAFCKTKGMGSLGGEQWLGILQYSCCSNMPVLVLLQPFFTWFFFYVQQTCIWRWSKSCLGASSRCFQHTFLLQQTTTNHLLCTMCCMLRVSTTTYRALGTRDAHSAAATTGTKQIMKPAIAQEKYCLFSKKN